MILVLVVLKNEKIVTETSTLVYTYYFNTSNITGDFIYLFIYFYYFYFFSKYKNDHGQWVAFSFDLEF